MERLIERVYIVVRSNVKCFNVLLRRFFLFKMRWGPYALILISILKTGKRRLSELLKAIAFHWITCRGANGSDRIRIG